MSGPGAFVLLDAPSELSPSGISEALAARHPDVPIVIPPLDDGGSTKATLLNISGTIVVLMQFDAPLPDGWQEAASRAMIHWPEAEAVFGRHRAHILVSIMGESENRLRIARVITAVVGALVASHAQCSAVLWDLTVANSSRVFADLSRSAFAPHPDFPSGLWVSLHPFQDPDALVVLTMGLSSFIGREIELEGQASQLEDLLTTAHGFATYLLQDGVKLRDGDTIGVSATERIPVRFMESRRFEGLPVIAASLATA
jgi:uncharacterized protein DUF4261